ncbi:MAG: SEC-C metal-binding domain-containing protein [Syntrophobacteraceae bacterium]
MDSQQSGGAPRPPVDPMKPVVELLRGGDPDVICSQHGISRAELDQQVEAFQNSQRELAMGDQLVMHQIGRNEPCPCGSGKKYKKCCMSKHEEARNAIPPDRLQIIRELGKAREKLEKDIGQGFELLAKEDFVNVRKLADKLLARFPEDDRVHDMAVSVALATGDYDSAHERCRTRWQVATEEREFHKEHGFYLRAEQDGRKHVHFHSPSTWLEMLWIAQRARVYRTRFPQQGRQDLAGLAAQLKAANDAKRFTGRQTEGYEERKRALAPVLTRIEAAGEAAIPYLLPKTYVFSWASLFVPELLRAWGSDTCLRLLGELSMFRLPFFAHMCLTSLASFGDRSVPIIDEILKQDAAFDELKVGMLSVLGEIRTPESRDILVRMIDHENLDVVRWSARSLEQHEDPECEMHLDRAKERLDEHSQIAGAIRDLSTSGPSST